MFLGYNDEGYLIVVRKMDIVFVYFILLSFY